MRDACPGSVLAAPPIAEKRFPGTRWDAIVRGPQDLAALLDQQGLDSRDVRAWCTQDTNTWMQVRARLWPKTLAHDGVRPLYSSCSYGAVAMHPSRSATGGRQAGR